MRPSTLRLCWMALLLAAGAAGAAGADGWQAPARARTTITRPTPVRNEGPRPVEVAIDFPLLWRASGLEGEFDPASLRVVDAGGNEIPFAYRIDGPPGDGQPAYVLAWIDDPAPGSIPVYTVYFDSSGQALPERAVDPARLPPENLLVDPLFDQGPAVEGGAWKTEPAQMAGRGRFAHTTGTQSLRLAHSENGMVEAVLSQRLDVSAYAGQEMVFECDLLAAHAPYGVPVSIELRQYRADGSRLLEYAVEPRWLTLELAEGHLVRFSERGRFHPEAADAELVLRIRALGREQHAAADPGEPGFLFWLDRFIVRPGERWPWPERSAAGFVDGALDSAPLNRGFEFSGPRRLVFNGASEGTLTAGVLDPGPQSVHWGLKAGTIEFWCRPNWDAEDGGEHVFLQGIAIMHRQQSLLRKLPASGNNLLEFTIADADGNDRRVRGPAALRAGQWHHVAATWDFPRAHLQLFVDGERIAEEGPGAEPWPASLSADSAGRTRRGRGLRLEDGRSIPMQVYVGGDRRADGRLSAESVLDAFRVSDTVRYAGSFAPPRTEFTVDEHTRAWFPFENERHGAHYGEDRFVRGYLLCELEPYRETADLEVRRNGRIERPEVLVAPHAPDELFEQQRVENRLTVTRPMRALPDPRFVEYRERRIEREITRAGEEFTVQVEGDYEPLMRSVNFEQAAAASAASRLPAWRINEAVVPFSMESLRATLAAEAATDQERAIEIFRYMLAITQYYDPGRAARYVSSVDLLRVLTVLPFDQCGPLNTRLFKLYLTMGLSANNYPGTHHQYQQAFYDGRWRLIDLSPRKYWLRRDNWQIASQRDIEEDLHLMTRQDPGMRVLPWLPAYTATASMGRPVALHPMEFPLNAGESTAWHWHNEGQWFALARTGGPMPISVVPPLYGNSVMVYQPAPGDNSRHENLVLEPDEETIVRLRAADQTRPATLWYRAATPFLFSAGAIQGHADAAEPGAVRLAVSYDSETSWTEFWRNPAGGGPFKADLPDELTGKDEYTLRVELAPAATVNGLQLRSLLVTSPLAWPGRFQLGDNRVQLYGGEINAPLRAVCHWTERHRSDLALTLEDGVQFYTMEDDVHRNLLVAAPDTEFPVRVAWQGRPVNGELVITELPAGWEASPDTLPVQSPATGGRAEFRVRPHTTHDGDIHSFVMELREGLNVRRLRITVLIAHAAWTIEAEAADAIRGNAAAVEWPECSGGQAVRFDGNGALEFSRAGAPEGRYVLWARARWEPGFRNAWELGVNDEPSRRRHIVSGPGGHRFWNDPDHAYSKVFHHYGDLRGHWAWVRVPGIELPEGIQRLTVRAQAGGRFDALVLLPDDDAVDRAAGNLFQNWHFEPWYNAR